MTPIVATGPICSAYVWESGGQVLAYVYPAVYLGQVQAALAQPVEVWAPVATENGGIAETVTILQPGDPEQAITALRALPFFDSVHYIGDEEPELTE